MDTLRGNYNFGIGDETSDADDTIDDEIERQEPPSPVGQDERRMQVRAYNHWASLLDDRNFPSTSDFDAADLPDFGPYAVLLDFSAGVENPSVTFLGETLRQECEIDANIKSLAEVPPRSLLTRITDHYLQIIANQAPIGFEAEFINQRDLTVLYRGILLPFSSDDQTIDHVLGVINWKELADPKVSDELLLEIDQALAETDELPEKRMSYSPLTDWADGPATESADDAEPVPPEAEDEDILDLGELEDATMLSPMEAGDYGADEEALEKEEESAPSDDLPRPSFGSLTGGGFTKAPITPKVSFEDEDQFGSEVSAEQSPDGSQPLIPEAYEAPEASTFDPSRLLNGDASGDDDHYDDFDETEDAADLPEPRFGLGDILDEKPDEAEAEDAPLELSDDDVVGDDTASVEVDNSELEADEQPPVSEIASDPEPGASEVVPEEAHVPEEPSEPALADQLAVARESAEEARSSEDRSRKALYAAIGRAYDFALAANDAPDEFAEILKDAGLTSQKRAPMTPIVKLVFGADYDKSRLTEYAAALAYAKRRDTGAGEFEGFIETFDGGLKAIIAEERKLRRAESGKKTRKSAPQKEQTFAKLRSIAPRTMADIDTQGDEFALVMVRRTESGKLVVLGEVPSDETLLVKAAKKLVPND